MVQPTGRGEIVNQFVDAGYATRAKVDAKDMEGDSPLTCASWHKRPDSILRKLVDDEFSLHSERWTLDASLLAEPHS
jgi:hypothetical protein